MDAHVDDLIAILDHAGVDRAVVVGHSMGCNFAARLAVDHPERCAAILLLDSGVPLVSETVVRGDGTEDTEPRGIFDRFETTFANGEEYLRGWREHPALKAAWDDDIEIFVRHDFVEDANGARCVANFDAVLTDVNDLLFDTRTWRAGTRVRVPVRLMRAERGMHDDHPLIPLPELHFTLLIGGGDGPRRVADAVGELVAQEH